MVYEKMVQIGRVAVLSGGPDQGKLCAIVEIIDANRALIDGPCSGVKRGEEMFKNMMLTKWVVPIRHGARQRSLKNAWETAKINEQWADSSTCKKLKMHEMRNTLINREFTKLKKAYKKNPPKPKTAKPKAKAKGGKK